MRRVRHIILILIGREPYAYSTERMEFDMALDKFNAAVANLSAAADALIAKAGSDAAALAQANTDLSNADDTTSAVVQAQADKINAAVNPPSAS